MKIAVIGCGVMGSAFARHFARKHQVVLFDKQMKHVEELATECGGIAAKSLEDAAVEADVIFLGVKPHDLPLVGKALSGVMTPNKILLSILAGTSLNELHRHIGVGHLVRIMPNLALTCGQGVVGMVDDGKLSPEVKKTTDTLLEGLGLTAWMPESKLEALTALSASGIGFIFLIMEAMMEGGICMGFTSSESKEFVLKTMEGAIAMVRQSGKHPAELKLNISSPAGMTIMGLKELEDRGVRSGIINAILAAYHRGQTLLKPL